MLMRAHFLSLDTLPLIKQESLGLRLSTSIAAFVGDSLINKSDSVALSHILLLIRRSSIITDRLSLLKSPAK